MQHSKYPLILTLALTALVVPGRAALSQVPTVPATTIRIASRWNCANAIPTT